MIAWIKAWNKIIRKVIFPDYQLKQLMKIPADTKIVDFIHRYFIRAGYTNELLTNQVCRIVYGDVSGKDTDVPNVRKNMMTFDIYVKTKHLYDTDEDDMLISRTQLIASRLEHLLTKHRYVCDTGYRFWVAGDWDLGTRTSGYSRYTISFYYMKVY